MDNNHIAGASPNSTFENEDTIRLESSVASASPGTAIRYSHHTNMEFNDQDLYQFDSNAPFIPIPPIAITHNAPHNMNHHSGYGVPTTPQFNNFAHENPSGLAPDFYAEGQSVQSQGSFHFSVFSNANAAASVNSLHNSSQGNPHPSSMFKLNMESTPDLSNHSITANQSSELLYNLTEYELGNPSLESIPDAMIYNSSMIRDTSNIVNTSSLQAQPQSQEFNGMRYSLPTSNSLNDFSQYPYTPTLSDVYTPTLSDSSFTPNSSVNNTTVAEEYNTRAPMPLVFKPLPNSSSSNSLSHKVTKKPSITRLNNNFSASINSKKNIMISTHISNSASNSQLSDVSPRMSPLCNKYKGLEIHQPNQGIRSLSNNSNGSTNSSIASSTPISNSILPPMNVFRHNSDSSTSSFYNSETPRRKTYPTLNEVSLKKSKKQAKKYGKDIKEMDPYLTPGKPKKYTRRRLLPRSKNGCWICRIKHLKCDEIRPTCTSCAKFGIECDYNPEKPEYVTDKNQRKEKLMTLSIVRKQKQTTAKAPKSRARQDSINEDNYLSSESVNLSGEVPSSV
ncbi:UME6 C6 zinc finger URS1-binding protein-like protein [Scheffersomyces xylosifermentans]|uniref:UME6 C6 zinc finger URS1-binding protein-like protein n=1 Tax=Scheffersomyces xylosifermentans TaxID=1304137 RepID=UPI00315CCC9B